MKKTAFLLISSLLVSESAYSMGYKTPTEEGEFRGITTSVLGVSPISQNSDIEYGDSNKAKQSKSFFFQNFTEKAETVLTSAVKFVKKIFGCFF